MHCLMLDHGSDLDRHGDDGVPLDETYEYDGRTYRKTGGHYGMAFNGPKGGL